MSITAEEVVVKLRAEQADYDRKIAASTRATESAFGRLEKSSNAVEATLRRNGAMMAGSMKGLAASFATYFTGRELTGILDSFTRLQNNLRVAGIEGDALKQVQDRLFASAQRYGVGIEELSSLFSTLTQASKELGASQEDVFGITDAVSASLKITGLSAEQAQGALLQLGQALRGGTVQAEEYNSLLDGLYPLLEAAANGSARFGGSVASLTRQVKDGKVTSAEFFNAILAGSDVLEGKAAKATLTLSAGVTTLTNALTVYFGEADKANGVSAALGDALKSMADNLDSLIPAIAIITTALGVNFVVSAVNAANATAALSGGLTVLQRLPVVAAITAIAVAIAYVGTESARTQARLSALDANFDSLAKKVDGATARAIAAGQNISIVGNASVTAAGKVDQLGRAFQSAAGHAATLAAQAKIATLAMIGTERTKAQNELTRLQDQQRTSNVVGKTFGIAFAPVDYVSGERGRRAARQERRQGQIDDLRKRLGDLDRLENQAVQIDPRSFIDPEKPAATPSPAKGGRVGSKGASGPTASEITERYTQELRQIVARDLQSRLAVATGADDRAEIEHRLLNDEIRSAEEAITANKQFSDARKGKLLAELKSYEVSERARIERERSDKAARVELSDLADRRDTLEAQADLLRSRKDRLAAELRILDIVDRQEAKELEIAISAGQVADVEAARARLAARQAARREGVIEKGAGPLARRARELETTNIGDEVERYAVEELQHFQDGLRNAITKKLGIKDPFLASLLDLFIQQNIIKPLTQALAGANGGGGGNVVGSLVAGAKAIFGFAGGGSGTIGGRGGTDTNVLSLNGQNFANVSRGETLSIGSKALNSRSSATIVQPIIQVDARGAVMNDQFATMILSQANQTAASMVQAGGRAINANIPNRIAQFQRDGT